MSSNEVEILLVEDNPNDVELAIRALKEFDLANKLIWLRKGITILGSDLIIDFKKNGESLTNKSSKECHSG